ncbi:MAG: hypothetical protein AB7N76_34390 [Planctomycetota bacterium]
MSGDEDDLEVEVLPDGRVRIHARCRVGQDPAECAARVRALVEALGVPEDVVETAIEEVGEAPPERE